jgi:hypothetical protein
MNRRLTEIGWVRLAPVLTVGIMVVLAMVLPNRTRVVAADLDRQAMVAAALHDAPYLIRGRWVGRDIAVPPAAKKLLHTNAILSRRFERIGGGATVRLLLVHCTDVRDMGGHYPPVCYPSAGWTPVDAERPDAIELLVGGQPLPLRVYEFSRIEGGVRESRIRVFNVFILPDGSLTTNIGQVRGRGERRAVSARGVAQLQVVTTMTMGDEDAADAAREILEGMPGLMTALGVWEDRDEN